MKNLLMLIALTLLFGSGCAIKSDGARTFHFGEDGVTVVSETLEGSAQTLSAVEMEKTRQVCYKAQKDKRKEITDMFKDKSGETSSGTDKLVMVLLAQNETVNNAMSLMKTGKNYDPCPSSTNLNDVEIADAAMYSSIYKEGFGALKFGAGMWGAVAISDNLFSAFTKLGAGYSFTNNGSGTMTIDDSFKEALFGDAANTGNLFTNEELFMELNMAPATP